jgi:abhydrolase domain-containing protein 17
MRPYAGKDPDKTNVAETFAIAGKIAALLVVGYALIAVVAHFVSLGMIFPRPPLNYALGPDYVQLTALDGTKLAARHWPNPGAKYTMFYLHGNYEDLGSVGEYIPSFLKAGYAVFAFDYRGYGHSEGSATEANVYADTRLAYDYLRTKLGVPPERIVIFGYSLGGGPGVELALHEPAAGLVLQGTFVSTYRVMTRYPLVVGDKFVNLAKAPKLKLPVLYLHGTEDRTVPIWHGEALYAATQARKTKLFVEGGHHSGLADFTGPRYWETLKAFTDSL